MYLQTVRGQCVNVCLDCASKAQLISSPCYRTSGTTFSELWVQYFTTIARFQSSLWPPSPDCGTLGPDWSSNPRHWAGRLPVFSLDHSAPALGEIPSTASCNKALCGELSNPVWWQWWLGTGMVLEALLGEERWRNRLQVWSTCCLSEHSAM